MTSIKHIIPGNKVKVSNRVLSCGNLLLFRYNVDTIPWHPPILTKRGEYIDNPFYKTLPKCEEANIGDILEVVAITGTKKTHRIVEVTLNNETFFVYWYMIRYSTEEIV
jgi:hypothetical protein